MWLADSEMQSKPRRKRTPQNPGVKAHQGPDAIMQLIKAEFNSRPGETNTNLHSVCALESVLMGNYELCDTNSHFLALFCRTGEG